MAITFSEKRKKQKYLILVLIVVLLITAIVVWWGFFMNLALFPPEEILKPPPKVEIDFEVLKSPILEEFQPFEEISPWQEEIGRENPFIPY